MIILIQVIDKLVPKGHPNRPCYTNNPIAIIVHYTANYNKGSNALAHTKYVSRDYIKKDGKVYEINGVTPFVYGCAHVYIDNISAYRVIPYNEYAPAAGDTQLPKNNGYNGQTKIAKEVFNHKQNYMSIQYELCINGDGDWNKTVDNAIEIIARDMIKYNIPIEHVYRHYDLTGKICPKPFVDNPKDWERFINRLDNKIKELKGDFMFKDIKGHYAEKYIEAVAKTGLMVGDGNGIFNPDQPITRAQMAVILAKLLHMPIEDKK